jgi:acyl-CoA thioesterase FadM
MTELWERGARVLTRPRYEGANIRTWIGFKHFLYLVEEAVLQWFREFGVGPQRLYHEHGYGLEVIESSAQLPSVLEIDDPVAVELTPTAPGRFGVRVLVERAGRESVALRGRVRVALVRERGPTGAVPLPEPLVSLAVDGVAEAHGPEEARPAPSVGTFVWPWRARYFHCHYSNRVQHSAYVRALEEVVDRFLESRGVSVRRLLEERDWIPVVSRVRVTLLADAEIDDLIETRFQVRDVLKRTAYDGTMECSVTRGAERVRVARADILHGYAIARGERAGTLAELDDDVIAALRRGER